MIVGSPTQSQFSDANQEDSANRKKRKTNLSNSTLNCQHIVWSLFVDIKINYEGIDYERMYCPSCNADMVPKTSVIKAHLNARHEKVSKAVMKIERRKKKME
uniref:BED-type domain-containing protein n=1 Tax=Ditylenchus dipsaci TaxID=166011 RepID=A0A915E317_9BILA